MNTAVAELTDCNLSWSDSFQLNSTSRRSRPTAATSTTSPPSRTETRPKSRRDSILHVALSRSSSWASSPSFALSSPDFQVSYAAWLPAAVANWVVITGCWRRSAGAITATAILMLTACLLASGAMGLWHTVEFFEKEKVVGDEYFQQWPNVSLVIER